MAKRLFCGKLTKNIHFDSRARDRRCSGGLRYRKFNRGRGSPAPTTRAWDNMTVH